MIRTHLIMILLLAQAVFSERLVVKMATGGRGVVAVVNLLDPWATLLLVIIPFWKDLRKALWTKECLLFWMPFLALYITLPFLGIAFGGFPIRSAMTSWNGIVFCAFLAIGAAGGFHTAGRERVIKAYFMFAVLAQFGMAMVQTLGQFEYLPGILKPIYEWDFQFKATYMTNNIILGRATGFYLNPNSLGIWAILATWTSFFLLTGRARAVGFVASFITILLCQSRGTLAAFLISGSLYGLIWMFRDANREQRLKATLFVVACAIPILLFAISGVLDSTRKDVQDLPVVGRALERYVSGAKVLSEGAAADANFQGRTEYWREAFRYLAEHPLGSLGSPEMVILVPPDNQFIAALEQGSFYFFAALILAFYGAVRLIRRPQAQSRLLAVVGLGLAVNGVSAVPFAYPAAFLFWLLVGVHLADRARHREEDLLVEELVRQSAEPARRVG